jgi:DNA adenine methylase
MQYQGGKVRLAKHIAEIINTLPGDVYVEPFVGGGSVLARVEKSVRLASDNHGELIAMWQSIQRGWQPPEHLSPQSYADLRAGGGSTELRAFCGYGGSWGGKYFGGYARGEGRNFIQEARNRLLRIAPSLQSAWFAQADYRDLRIPDGAIVYADPPYAGTAAYSAVGRFDNDEFWAWAGALSRRATVLVSELAAPDGWQSVWCKGHISSYVMDGREAGKRTECLWMAPSRAAWALRAHHRAARNTPEPSEDALSSTA